MRARREDMPPEEFREIIDEAVAKGDLIIVGEAHGASRAFQRYLHSKGVGNVVVGHAKTIRYNAGGWLTHKYGNSVPSRKKAFIDDCYARVSGEKLNICH